MIPLKLTLRDFLSYADPDPIDFSRFDVACLTGENGAGKSAILDAMTWALFGAARGCEGGQNQDRLIRDGCDGAAVDFRFGLNGSTYRVVRRRSRSGRSELRFLLAHGDDWTNLAGETLRETDASISSLLRMDYKTFTASAFFVQGRAEDFLARMRPEERKEVFARLLDLGAYERLEEAARGKARDAQVRRSEHARRAEELAGPAGEAAAVEAELAQAERQAGLARGQAEALAGEVETKRTALTGLERAHARAEAERAALAQTEDGLAEMLQSIKTKTDELRGLDELLTRADEVAAALDEAKRLTENESEAREAQQRAFDLEKRRSSALEQIETERKIIGARVLEARRGAAVLNKELQELSKREKELERVDRALDGSDDPRPAIEETRRGAEEQRAAEARFTEQLKTIDAVEAERRERKALLARGEATCPVCGGALDAQHRQRVERELREQAANLKKDRERARAARETARKEAERYAEELRRLDGVVREREKLTASRDGLRVHVERIPVRNEELAALECAAAADAQLLADEGFARELSECADRLGAEIRAAYDPAAHEALRRRIAELEPYAVLGGRIEEGSARRTSVERELSDLAARSASARTALDDRKKAVSALEAELTGLPSARAGLDDALRRLEAATTAASAAGTDVARLTERLEAVRRAVAEKEEAVRAEREAAAEHRRYQRLSQAFGRGGIPDLVIDNARPHLEEDANAILGRLTDYDMSVHFEMQREMRSGKSKETFDVLVHHEGGLRDFSMFSGGEAFRIAFAVRLALSKLLVGRAGARLETLVIDEGFGTQDPEGRERLVEAVGLARSEFSKILVITHLDDLKDLFGAQIQVTKDPARGSVVTVIDP